MSSSSAFGFILILASISVGMAAPFRFDYKYSQDASGWLKFHEMPATWHEARLQCHAEGAVLLSPIDENFLLEMIGIMAIRNISCGIFTGIHASFAKGVFTSLQGVPLSRIPVTWAPDEPDNFENSEDCLMMLPNGTMADVKCGEVFPFICYKEMPKKVPLSGCGTVDDEYSMDLRTGTCYKFHTVGQTFSNAFKTCVSEGGHLAIINSETEALVIKELFDKYPSSALFTNYENDAYVGIIEWNEQGEWFTIYGETLEEAGYNEWDENQPRYTLKEGVSERCGGITRNGKFSNIWCNEATTFICEKKPDSLL